MYARMTNEIVNHKRGRTSHHFFVFRIGYAKKKGVHRDRDVKRDGTRRGGTRRDASDNCFNFLYALFSTSTRTSVSSMTRPSATFLAASRLPRLPRCLPRCLPCRRHGVRAHVADHVGELGLRELDEPLVCVRRPTRARRRAAAQRRCCLSRPRHDLPRHRFVERETGEAECEGVRVFLDPHVPHGFELGQRLPAFYTRNVLVEVTDRLFAILT